MALMAAAACSDVWGISVAMKILPHHAQVRIARLRLPADTMEGVVGDRNAPCLRRYTQTRDLVRQKALGAGYFLACPVLKLIFLDRMRHSPLGSGLRAQ